VSAESAAVLRFDMLQSDKGSYFNFDMFYGFPIAGDRLPWCLDFGLNFGALSGPQVENDSGYMGIFLGLVAPVTRFAQIEAKLAGMLIEPYWTAEVHGVVNLGNRFYARAGVVVFQGTSYVLGAGVKP
jgi:hypothetical protein